MVTEKFDIKAIVKFLADIATNKNFKFKSPTQVLGLVNALRKYHRHEVIGIENIPNEGRGLLAVNHSLATYDIVLLAAAIYEQKKRIPNSLADRLFYKIPYLGEVIESLGARKGTRENAVKLLEEGNIVFVAPGGMRESLRPSSERYQILWKKRKGFVELALKTQSPVILCACPKADDIYEVFANPVTALIYRKFKLPIFIAKGLGPTPIPKPVKLVHYIGKPVIPPAYDKTMSKEELASLTETFHKKIIGKMNNLMAKAVRHRPNK